jgi:hypothetical protein
VRLIQEMAAPIWRRVQGGDRLAPDLVTEIEHAGFDVRVDGWLALGFMARIDARRRA